MTTTGLSPDIDTTLPTCHSWRVAVVGRVDGKKIRDARLTAGMSQSQLARAVQTTERNIMRWESSSNQPRVESVVAIAQATGRDLDFFLTGASEEEDDEEAAQVSSHHDMLAALAAALEPYRPKRAAKERV